MTILGYSMATSKLLSKIISLSDARSFLKSPGDNVMKQGAERRIETRTISSERLFVQVTSSEEKHLIGATFSCYSLDVSSGGLRIASEAPIPEGSKLDLWIESSRRPGKYFLTSNVRWSEAAANGDCFMGIELIESPTTDIDQWRLDH
ncbi:MAG: hypothetical protein ACI82A_000677 [Candidatus Azotimanducaceae bacterium]|jgi:hypothetical protein